jgi:flagellar biogenesis protein FliO
MYGRETAAAFARQRALHIVLLLAATLCILTFLVFLFRPFLAQVGPGRARERPLPAG